MACYASPLEGLPLKAHLAPEMENLPHCLKVEFSRTRSLLDNQEGTGHSRQREEHVQVSLGGTQALRRQQARHPKRRKGSTGKEEPGQKYGEVQLVGAWRPGGCSSLRIQGSQRSKQTQPVAGNGQKADYWWLQRIQSRKPNMALGQQWHIQ